MFASLRPTWASYSEAYPPRIIMWMASFAPARNCSPSTLIWVVWAPSCQFAARGLYPLRTRASATSLASATNRSRFMDTPSSRRKYPRSRHSSALVPTLAMAIASKTGFSAWNKSRSSPPAARSFARMSISFDPPPPGIKPTPASTNPRYASAAA